MTITVTPDTIPQALAAMRLDNPTKRFATDLEAKESLWVQQSNGAWACLITVITYLTQVQTGGACE